MTLRTAGNTSELADDIRLSERLSRMQGQDIGPGDVVSVLRAAGVKHVLVGAHAISAWAGDPRATLDVDVVASRPDPHKPAMRLWKRFQTSPLKNSPSSFASCATAGR